MLSGYVDPNVRRSLALGAVMLSLTGLVLVRGGGPLRGGSQQELMAGRAQTPSPALGFASEPPANRPTTSSSFAGSGAEGRAALSQGAVLAAGNRTVQLELRVKGSEGAVGRRAPLAMVLVVDTSGSMSGTKIADARRAATTLVDEMRDDDAVGVVRFSTGAEVVAPLERVGEGRERARQAIASLVASGNTDIARAVRVAAEQLETRAAGRVRRMALVTDGRDTSGAPRGSASEVASREARHGVTVSTLGIGVDYDDAFLADLATAGHGNYEFLKDSSALSRFLKRELDETAKTIVETVRLDLDLPRNARIRDVWGGTWDQAAGAAGRIDVGSLFAGDERRVIVSLEVTAGAVDSDTTLGGAVSWSPVGGARVSRPLGSLVLRSVATEDEVERSRDGAVIASVTSVEASQRESEAAAAFARGDRKQALDLNAMNLAQLEKAAASAPSPDAARLRAQRKAYGADGIMYGSQPASAASARAIGAREHQNFSRNAF